MSSVLQLQTADLPAWAPPSREVDEWMRLPVRYRERVTADMESFRLIDMGRSSGLAINDAAAAAALRRGPGRGNAPKSIADRYRLWSQKDRDWRVLVPGWRNPSADPLPAAFVRYWQQLVVRHQRSDGTRAAYRTLLQTWVSGGEIPGYGTWRDWWKLEKHWMPTPSRITTAPADLPKGWSYANLWRRMPKQSVVVSARQGEFAAHSFQTGLIRDRSALRPMELIVLDDFWVDKTIVFPDPATGRLVTGRAIGCLALDVATGLRLGWLLRPRTSDAMGLRREEVRELLVNIFASLGLPPYPVTVLVENASAAISPDDELAIRQCLGDQVEIRRTGMLRGSPLEGEWGSGSGQPWAKGWIEANIRLIHTNACALPGETGPNSRTSKPAEHDAMVAYTQRIIKAAGVNPVVLDRLRLPLLTYDQAREAYDAILVAADERHDHRMQGFEQVLTARDLSTGEWVKQEDMTPDMQLGDITVQMESPRERWMRLCRGVQFSEVPEYRLLPLLQRHRRLTLNGNAIRFDDAGAGGRLVFWSEAEAPLLRQHAGREVLAWYSDKADWVHLTDAATQAYLGSVSRQRSVGILNESELGRAAGAIHRDRLREREETRDLLEPKNERIREIMDANEAVLPALAAPRKGRLPGDTSLPGAPAAQALTEGEAQRRAQATAAKALRERRLSGASDRLASLADAEDTEPAAPAPRPERDLSRLI
jgi:hypothetical protein